jgi:hypothetical protein
MSALLSDLLLAAATVTVALPYILPSLSCHHGSTKYGSWQVMDICCSIAKLTTNAVLLLPASMQCMLPQKLNPRQQTTTCISDSESLMSMSHRQPTILAYWCHHPAGSCTAAASDAQNGAQQGMWHTLFMLQSTYTVVQATRTSSKWLYMGLLHVPQSISQQKIYHAHHAVCMIKSCCLLRHSLSCSPVTAC